MKKEKEISEEELSEQMIRLIKKMTECEKKRLENIKKLVDKEKLRKVSKIQLLKILIDVVSQACEREDGEVDSYATSAYANALYLLAELGLFEIEASAYRRVIGRWKKGVWGEDI